MSLLYWTNIIRINTGSWMYYSNFSCLSYNQILFGIYSIFLLGHTSSLSISIPKIEGSLESKTLESKNSQRYGHHQRWGYGIHRHAPFSNTTIICADDYCLHQQSKFKIIIYPQNHILNEMGQFYFHDQLQWSYRKSPIKNTKTINTHQKGFQSSIK